MRSTRYQIYGLTLTSPISFPELNPTNEGDSQAACDVQLRLSDHHTCASFPLEWQTFWTLPTGEPWLLWAKTKATYHLRFPDLADFTVNDTGCEIICFPFTETPTDTLRHLLLDQVLPLVLNLTGRESLHATAVLTPVGVCAFMGPTGAGKSTLAASFSSMSYPVVSDDCLVLQNDAAQTCVVPAYPGVRLWEDALEALGENPSSLISVAHYTSKKRLVLADQSTDVSLGSYPLARVYSLVWPTEEEEKDGFIDPFIERLSHRDGFMALVEFAFRFDITDSAMLSRQFHFFEQVATHVRVRRLHLPNSFAALPKVRELILADLESE